jgi:hypothetical protein
MVLGLCIVTSADASVGPGTLPSPFGLHEASCSTGTAAGSVDRVTGPGTPPAGIGSLRVDSGTTPAIVGPQYTVNLPAAELQTWTLGHYETGTGAGQLVAEIQIDRDGTGTHTDLLDFSPTETGGVWQNLDVLAQQLVYTPAGGSASLTSWPNFVTSHPAAVVTDILFVTIGCGPSQIMNVDNWVVKTNGTTHTYDFEPAPALTSATSATTIVATKPVGLSTTVRGDGVPMVGQSAELWARTYPSTTYRLIALATTNASGVATSTQFPEVQTTYRWHVDIPGFDAATSPTRTVNARTRLTANVLDSTLGSTQALVLWGSTRTARSKQVVTLVRRTSSGLKTLAKTHTRSDGTYFFQQILRKGSYRLFTKIGAGQGDVAGTSADMKVRAS